MTSELYLLSVALCGVDMIACKTLHDFMQLKNVSSTVLYILTLFNIMSTCFCYLRLFSSTHISIVTNSVDLVIL